ncbi:MAG: NAD(P)-dependent oxidoreductase [Gaiellales bacterium]
MLVTGAGGFVGAAALASLARGGHEVHAISTRPRPHASGVMWHTADLHVADAAHELMALVRPEQLLHLAWYAEHGRYWTSVENVRWVEATLRLLRAFADQGGVRAVVAGTCAEYDWELQSEFLSEDSTPLRPATLYGACKDATRRIGEALADEAGFALAWGRIFFVYGPGETGDRLVPSVVTALLEKRPARVTEGLQVRDFMHVHDVGAAFVALLDSDVHGAVNIGSGEGVTVRHVVEAVGAATGCPDLIEFGGVATRPGEPAAIVADVGRLRDEVGFLPRTSLRDGVQQTVEWWQARPDSISVESV